MHPDGAAAEAWPPPATAEMETLVRQYAGLIASAIRRVCGGQRRQLRPDVEQEVYLALWKRLRTGKAIDYPAAYIYKVALTTAVAVVRRQPREERFAPGLEDNASSTPAAESGRRPVQGVEAGLLLREALAQLSDEQSQAVRAYLAGFNHQEVARLWGWTESVARHRIYRGLEALRKHLSEH